MFANYEDRLANGEVDIWELIVSKRITREPRDYQKAAVTAIAAQQLFGSGVKLRRGQNIEYVITNAEAHVPDDRVRAFALWEVWFCYDQKKYAAMLREAFQPFELFIAEPTLQDDSSQIRAGEDWRDTPLFTPLKLPHNGSFPRLILLILIRSDVATALVLRLRTWHSTLVGQQQIALSILAAGGSVREADARVRTS